MNKKSLNEINISNKKFNVHVLQGITGSGKTIVYFEALKNLRKGFSRINYAARNWFNQSI